MRKSFSLNSDKIMWIKVRIMNKPISKKEKVEAIINILDELYPEVPIPLDHEDHTR